MQRVLLNGQVNGLHLANVNSLFDRIAPKQAGRPAMVAPKAVIETKLATGKAVAAKPADAKAAPVAIKPAAAVSKKAAVKKPVAAAASKPAAKTAKKK